MFYNLTNKTNVRFPAGGARYELQRTDYSVIRQT